ncbi:hypothetical protein FIBSPDRAFT_930108 [Athelia psychrophila]|uniref:Uncharacterized protein n=1 Tax=Athelia psychrophila TaxID=1759441 RepID=A0A166MNH4_9AGAM|nr:hypothetical protein FIBSPDRAFT_930108 [Fibularhizoctonia sp. CBS 109695]
MLILEFAYTEIIGPSPPLTTPSMPPIFHAEDARLTNKAQFKILFETLCLGWCNIDSSPHSAGHSLDVISRRHAAVQHVSVYNHFYGAYISGALTPTSADLAALSSGIVRWHDIREPNNECSGQVPGRQDCCHALKTGAVDTTIAPRLYLDDQTELPGKVTAVTSHATGRLDIRLRQCWVSYAVGGAGLYVTPAVLGIIRRRRCRVFQHGSSQWHPAGRH